MPIQLVRQRVINAIKANESIDFEFLVDVVFAQTSSDEYFTYADIKEIILDMLESGIIQNENNVVSINQNRLDEPEDPDYEVKKYISYDTKIDLTGDKKINSVGSEDFFYNLNEVQDGEEIIVELAPEPDNEYDENAVAIMYNNKIVGYFERRNAKAYHDKIAEYNANSESVIAKAKVVVSQELDDLKYVIVYILEE